MGLDDTVFMVVELKSVYKRVNVEPYGETYMTTEYSKCITTPELDRGMVVASSDDVNSGIGIIPYIIHKVEGIGDDDLHSDTMFRVHVIEPDDGWMGVATFTASSEDMWYVLDGQNREMALDRAINNISTHRNHLKQCKRFLKGVVENGTG